jgi:hypothetical protein
MLGEDISSLSVSDLLQLEKQLDDGASKVRARKASVRLFLNGVLRSLSNSFLRLSLAHTS